MPEIERAVHDRITDHFAKVTPLLAATFGAIPIAYATYPDGFEHAPHFQRDIENVPATIATVDVRIAGTMRRFVTLSEHNVVWLSHAKYPVELYSWSPTPGDPLRAAFARLLLTPSGRAPYSDVVKGAQAVRELLRAEGLDAVALLDGGRGIALWIPLADKPAYDVLSRWLHLFVAKALAAYPAMFTNAHLIADRGDRVFIGTISNHPGMFSILPYSTRGDANLPVAVPTTWDDVQTAVADAVTLGNFVQWFAAHGDLFGTLLHALPAQRLPITAPPTQTAVAISRSAHGVIDAALQVLADGKARLAQAILDDGRARNLFDAEMTEKHLYNDLYEYVMRTTGTGKIPEILQDAATHAFRINRPADTWPAIALTKPAVWLDAATVDTLCARLAQTAVGDDPTAFEIAVCDAFAALGFIATHYGGYHQPDGVLEAPLGVLGFRCIVECKTAKPGGVVNNPRAEEPASFRVGYGAQKALLIGPVFEAGGVLDGELQTHGVAFWTTANLIDMLQAQVGPYELRTALEPGAATPICEGIAWERSHGKRKRLAVLQERITTVLWKTQNELRTTSAAGNMPALNAQTLFLLVDTVLVDEGVADGAAQTEFTQALQTAVAAARVAYLPESDSFIGVQPPTPSSL